MPAEGAGGARGPGQTGRGGRTRRYRGFRARGPLLPTILVLVLVIIAFLIFTSFYTDWLWYKSIDYASVYTTRLRTQLTMFVVFGVITGGAVVLNAWLAYRFRPPFRGLSTEQQSLERYRVSVEPFRKFIAAAIGVLIGLMAGSSASAQWRAWLLFRNAVPFGTDDAQFHKDVSFYAFRLPFWRYLLGFGFAIVLLSLLVSLAVHYLYGGIKIQTPGERLTVAARVHISVLLGLFVLLKATAYWLDRFSLVLDQHRLGGSTGSSFTGASYTDVNAILPAKNILIGVALICAVLFFINVWRRTWQLPALGLALLVFSAVVIGGIYPAAIQYFKVRPSEPIREGPYIQRNINATRQAYGVGDVQPQTFTPNTDITTRAAKAADAVKPNVRLIDPVKIQASFTNKQQSRGYYNFADPLDIDRYNVENNELVSVVAVRELDPTKINATQQNWANLHTVYTHGFGFVAAAGNTVQADGTPSFFEQDVPPVGDIPIDQPRVYFGEDSTQYSIVGAKPNAATGQELDYSDDSAPGGQVNTTYSGKGGVAVGSLFRKTLFALKFKEGNLLLSDLVNSNSKILWDRTPKQRVEKAAPWLRLDGDPYPAVVGGRIVWILDGYTTSGGYPYSQRSSLGDATQDTITQSTTSTSVVAQQQNTANYIRNSVKATVDAYDGTVTLYEWDKNDPVLKVWERAFPGTVQPNDKIPAELAAHFRYPEDLFKIQREVLTRYHVKLAKSFYSGQDFWSVPGDPTLDSPNPPPQPPYYVQVRMPGQDAPVFSLTTTFTPRARNQASAFMSVDSNPSSDDFGTIRVLEFPQETNTPGPEQVQNNFEGNSEVSQELSLLRSKGSTVSFGNLLTLPIASGPASDPVNGLLYVEPVYVQRAAGSSSFPLLQKVLVAYGERIGFEDTLGDALDEMFTGSTTGNNDGTGNGNPTGATENQVLAQALADAQQAIADAKAALAKGDFKGYGDAQKRLEAAINQAAAAEASLAPSASPSTSASVSASSGGRPSSAASPSG
jgi:uncharacterized membrane protein (UPF0182 family)